MLLVTCDMCGKELGSSAGELHHTVKIHICTRPTGQLTVDDLDDDNMTAVSELLQLKDSEDLLHEGMGDKENYCYDLCTTCRIKFAKDPLNKENTIHMNFSEN